MSAYAERQLICHLLDEDSLRTLVKSGLNLEIIPSEDLRSIVVFALNYFTNDGELAPTPEVFEAHEVSAGVTIANVLDDLEVPWREGYEASLSWVLEDLKGSYVSVRSQALFREGMTRLAEADNVDRLEVLTASTGELLELVMSLQDRNTRVDMREAMAGRLANYHSKKNIKANGMSFGLKEIDDHILKIQPGELALLAAFAKVGKAQPLDEHIATPTGWRLMGDLKVGDYVLGRNGLPNQILQIHPQGVVDIYRVMTSDGASTRVCGDHLWMVKGGATKSQWHIISTDEIKRDLESGRKRFTYIPSMTQPAEFDYQDSLLISPYLLGFLIGGGGLTQGVRFTCEDQDFDDREMDIKSLIPKDCLIRKTESGLYQYSIVGVIQGKNTLLTQLRELGLMGCKSEDKFIPRSYMTASVEDRLSLLQGLLDTDGGMEGKCVTYSTSSFLLANQVQELVRSLGGTASMRIKKTPCLPSYQLRIKISQEVGCPFRLSRKVSLWQERRAFTQNRPPIRRITSIEFIGRQEAQCITVEASDHLYLTSDYLVTHNSYAVDRIALQEWENGRSVALFTLENSIDMTLDRLACIACSIDAQRWQQGECHDVEIQRIQEKIEEMKKSNTPLHILSPGSGQRSPDAMIREAQILDVDSVIIDQLSHVELPNSGKKQRNEVVREIMQNLKVNINEGSKMLPCLVAHQINRAGKKNADKVGWHEMPDLAESSEAERSADFVFSMYQSNDMFQVKQVLLQILAARRVPIKWWSIAWRVETGFAQVRKEVIPYT